MRDQIRLLRGMVGEMGAPSPVGSFGGDAFRMYASYYRLDDEVETRLFGVIASGANRIAVHCFLPRDYERVAILLHGYFDHSGSMHPLIAALCSERIAVVCADLPGHGLSSGERGSIADFSIYGRMFADLVQYTRRNIGRRTIFMGHSTGASAIIEAFESGQIQDNSGEPVIFLAPLVRTVQWGMIRIMTGLSPSMNLSLPRLWKPPSASDEYIRFVRYHDPLQNHHVSLSWVRALVAWNQRIEQMDTHSATIYVLQGDADRTVDWRYNCAFLERVFSFCTTKVYSGVRHNLLHEERPRQREIVGDILGILRSP